MNEYSRMYQAKETLNSCEGGGGGLKKLKSKRKSTNIFIFLSSLNLRNLRMKANGISAHFAA